MPEIREALEERMARVEGILSQIDKRFDSLERSVESRFDLLERRIDALDKKFYWLIGVIVATWIITILTILFKG